MTTSRRGVLKVLGGSAVILAAGAGGFVATRDPSAARVPWAQAGAAYPDPIRQALSYAILAPNPHNQQPWMVDLEGPRSATLYCDLDRRLPATDPFDRQIVIGLGCFLELARLAALESGHLARIDAFPEGAPAPRLDGRPVARIRLETPSAPPQTDPLFGFVPARRSNKEPFDTGRALSQGALDSLRAAVGTGLRAAASNDGATVTALRDLTWRGHAVEATTKAAFQESIDLMRIGKAEIEANPDGIDLGGPMMELLKMAGIMTPDQLADPASRAFAEGMAIYREILASAMGYLWLVSPGNSRRDQLATGAAYLRANLKATELGLGIHPISQTLQEYPEMSALYDEINGRLGIAPPERLQILARLGYGPEVAASPRWPLESKIRAS